MMDDDTDKIPYWTMSHERLHVKSVLKHFTSLSSRKQYLLKYIDALEFRYSGFDGGTMSGIQRTELKLFALKALQKIRIAAKKNHKRYHPATPD